MTDYTKLVKELRGCKDVDYCTDCPRMANGYVEFCNIKDDAAAAIEELQAENEKLRDTITIQDAELHPNPRYAEPKRGEWIIHGEPPMLVIECSVCGQKYFNHVMQEKAKYCSMCGAKMGGTE